MLEEVCVKCNSVVMEKEMVEATCLAELSFFSCVSFLPPLDGPCALTGSFTSVFWAQ